MEDQGNQDPGQKEGQSVLGNPTKRLMGCIWVSFKWKMTAKILPERWGSEGASL